MNRGLRIAARCALALCIAGTTIGGIQGTGRVQVYAFGVISETDEVTVNGVAYNASHARVSVNGQLANAGQLRAGQVAAISGSVDPQGNSAVADTISYVGDVRGRISSLTSDGRTFRVLHRTVRVADGTVFDGVSQSDLAVGRLVEASGYLNAEGEIVASRVAASDIDTDAQLRGVVSNLDTQARTFVIDTTLVDYDAAAVTGSISEGASVFVRGDPNDAGATLVAGRVDVLAPIGAEGAKGDVEGVVTSLASTADFWISGVHVVADEKTKYKATPAPDVAIHVSGRFDAGGALTADKIDGKVGKKPKKK